jgi:MEDS: MEthanogen/methylotroph, DcmR Sensory domain
MRESLRKSGIDIIGDVPWGAHLCQFYQTKEDLVDILVPYIKIGLENNEFCLCITSLPLEVEGAKEALRGAVPDIDAYIETAIPVLNKNTCGRRLNFLIFRNNFISLSTFIEYES